MEPARIGAGRVSDGRGVRPNGERHAPLTLPGRRRREAELDPPAQSRESGEARPEQRCFGGAAFRPSTPSVDPGCARGTRDCHMGGLLAPLCRLSGPQRIRREFGVSWAVIKSTAVWHAARRAADEVESPMVDRAARAPASMTANLHAISIATVPRAEAARVTQAHTHTR